MDTLEQARAEIDAVDAQLAALFERRMAAVLSVAQYKQAHGLPVYDAAREAVVLEKAAARIQDPALRPYYRDHVQNMMDVAKQYEAEVLGENRAAYQGVEGTLPPRGGSELPDVGRGLRGRPAGGRRPRRRALREQPRGRCLRRAGPVL